MELIPITRSGQPARPLGDLPEIADRIMTSTRQMYDAVGYQEPWIGYVAEKDGRCVGTCGFKTPPRDNAVEIAYFTFPGEEGRKIATEMAGRLIEIARNHAPTITITAQTLPEKNASNRILEKLGFVFSGEMEHSDDGTVWEWKLEG